MIKFLKRKKEDRTDAPIEKVENQEPQTGVEQNENNDTPSIDLNTSVSQQPDVSKTTTYARTPSTEKKGFFSKLKSGLGRTRENFTSSLANLILGKREVNEAFLDDLETILLSADVGVDATSQIISDLAERVSRKHLADPESLVKALQEELLAILAPCQQPLQIQKQDKPFVILMIGVNGAGKTTSIGKITHQFQKQGHNIILAAGDTFRAAAIEQLQTWGERNQVPVIAQHTGADSASVVYDALTAATSRQSDILIADTAGRLHTQHNLMEELKKVKRVIGKLDSNAPHEVLLVLDASNGQNALRQAELFHDAVGVTGLILTKLDGTAKGGILFAIAKKLSLPIRYIGVGEHIDDLREFDASDFVQALFSHDNIPEHQ